MLFILLVYRPSHFRMFIAFGWQLFCLLCRALDVFLVHTSLYKLSLIIIVIIIKQAKPTGTEVDYPCDDSFRRWTRTNCNGFWVCDAGTMGQRHPPRLTLPFSLSSLCYNKNDRQDIHGVKSKLGRHGYTGAPYVVIQLRYAVPCDCYPSGQLCFTTATTVNQSIAERNRDGAMVHPCLTPLLISNQSDRIPSMRTLLIVPVSSSQIKPTIFRGMPRM